MPGIPLFTKNVTKLLQPLWNVPPSPESLWENLGMGKNPTQQPKIFSFPPSEKSTLIYLNLSLSKVSFLPRQAAFSSNHPMRSSFVAAVISVVLYSDFMLYVHICHANLTNQCLLNVAFSMTKALNGWSSPKQNFRFLHFFHFLPPSLQYYFENPASIIACFLLFSHSLFYFKLYDISTDSTPIGIFWLCGLIKYNRLQISGNKSYETPYSMP